MREETKELLTSKILELVYVSSKQTSLLHLHPDRAVEIHELSGQASDIWQQIYSIFNGIKEGR